MDDKGVNCAMALVEDENSLSGSSHFDQNPTSGK